MPNTPKQAKDFPLYPGSADKQALEAIFPHVYNELRRLARHHLRQQRPNHTLQTTALVHEAYLRLAKEKTIPVESQTHFLGIASQLMRWILVDYERNRRAAKRGAGATRMTLDTGRSAPEAKHRDVDLLALDEALSYYQKVLGIRVAIVAASPHDSRAQMGLAGTNMYIGSLLRRKGDIAGARDSYDKHLAILQAMLRQDPSDATLQLDVALAQVYLAELYGEMAAKHATREKQIDDCHEAMRWADLAIPVFERLQREGKLASNNAGELAGVQQAKGACAVVLKSERH